VLTPTTQHEALRRSVESDLQGVAPDSVDLETVPSA
jgi:DNA-directed RNA polymerase alpha subunit